nr:putative no exine formation 1 [Tanacetum cinerariifolium]
MEKGDKPNHDLPDLSKIKRNKYPIYSTFEKKKTDCYLDCLPKGRTCEPSFWDILYPGDEKAEYLNKGKLDGLHINAFIELMMRKRPRNAQWTLGLSELVTFHIESRKLMSMVSVVDALRATIDGTNPSCMRLLEAIALVVVVICLDVRVISAVALFLLFFVPFLFQLYTSTRYIQVPFPLNYLLVTTTMLGGAAGVEAYEMGMIADAASSLAFKRHNGFFPINLDNKHWVAASWNLDDYVFTGKTIDIKSFGDNVGLKCQEYRAKMALMLYET